MKSVGIDIGSYSVKVVEVQHVGNSSKGVTITSMYEHRVGRSVHTDPKLEIVEFVRNLAESYNPETTRIVFGMPQDQVSVRNKIFPFSDRLKILKSLPFEMEEDFPFNPDQATYDGKVIKVMGQSAEVLACATPNAKVAAVLARARDCGINPHVLSPDGLAFANSWENWNETPPAEQNTQFQLDGESRPESKVELILDIGHTRTLLCALENGMIVSVRSLSWGGRRLAEHIAKKYEISLSEAQSIVETKAFILLSEENAAYDQMVFSQTICESVRELARDIQMSILEFHREFNAVTTQVSLAGGTSRITNLNGFLTQTLDLPVNTCSIISGRYAIAGAAATQMSERSDAIFGVALGLAIEGLRKPRNPAITFLRGEFARQNRKTQDFLERWGTALKSAAAAFIVFFVYSMAREKLASDLSDAGAENLKKQAKAIAHLNSKQATDGGVQKFLKDQGKRSSEAKLAQNLTKMPSALEILRKLSEAVPGKGSIVLQVNRLSVHDTRVEIEGYVGQPVDLQTLRQGLQGMAVGGRLDNLPRTPVVPAGKLGFAFSMNVDRGMAPATKAVQ
jgi:general secretion pathway protein L